MFKPEESYFDVVIVGTSLESSIKAYELAKSGKRILQLERSTWYGGLEDGTLDLEQATLHFTKSSSNPPSSELKSMAKKFCIDLNPRILTAGDALCQRLVNDGLSNEGYLEFRFITKIFISWKVSSGDWDLFAVPTCKEDIFKSGQLGLAEKRKIWKMVSDWSNGKISMPDKGGNLFNLLYFGICQFKTTQEAFTAEHINERIAAFRHGLGLYRTENAAENHTPFLYPIYGSSDLVQAYCRKAALYGATQLFGQGDSLAFEKEESSLILVSGRYDGMPWQVTAGELVDEPKPPLDLHRAVLVLDGPLLPESAENYKETLMLVIPPGHLEEDCAVYFLQCAPSTKCVPEPYCTIFCSSHFDFG